MYNHSAMKSSEGFVARYTGILRVLSIFTIIVPAMALAFMLGVSAIPAFSTTSFVFIVFLPVLVPLTIAGFVVAIIDIAVLPIYLRRHTEIEQRKKTFGWIAWVLCICYLAFGLYWAVQFYIGYQAHH